MLNPAYLFLASLLLLGSSQAANRPNVVVVLVDDVGFSDLGCYGGEIPTLNNTPFSRYKHFTHEGGISTPLIAHWPAGIPAPRHGALESQPGHLVDIMATCVDLSGAGYPKEFNGHAIEPMQGVSLRPAFDGGKLARTQPIFWEHEGNKAVRDGKWKLVQRHRLGWQLFNMESDRTEQRDLITQHPEIATRLEAAWLAWAQRTYVDDWNGPDHTDWGQDIKRALP